MASATDWRDRDPMPTAGADPYRDASSGFGHWRWLIGSMVLMPVLLAAGVYWLHQLPVGPSARVGDSTIHVELLPSPNPASEFKQASVQANPTIADFQVMPTIAEPVQSPVEQESLPQPPLNPPRPAAAPDQKAAGGGQSRPVPAGAAMRFQHMLQAHIERYQHYPNSEPRDGTQETVLVMFAMRRDGTLVRVDIRSSSGRPILDREAVETVRRAQPLPRIPADMPDLLTVLLPVTFDAR